ncbi:hypothetical protein LguiA_027051 [Lonicera macranthoides]
MNLFIHEFGEYINELIKEFEEKMRAKSLEDLQMSKANKMNFNNVETKLFV